MLPVFLLMKMLLAALIQVLAISLLMFYCFYYFASLESGFLAEQQYVDILAGIIGNIMADKTVCMNAKQASDIHYNVHSLYGWSQTLVTIE